jgi:signal transduction histidine kinase
MKEFVAIASHDLRTPITVIKGFAQTLEMQWDEISDEQRTRFLATIHRHVDHLGAIVDDLLTSSRIDAGAIAPALQPVALYAFVERVLADLDPDGATNAELDVPVEMKVSADPEHLNRVLSNLISNARRYGSPPVSIRATREAGAIVLRVCDAGPGLEPEFAARAFEKFARADKRRSKETQGTGLGLAIVRGLARAGGGDAWYEPVVPRGACFAVRLPG